MQLFHKNVTRNVTSSCLPYFRSILPFYTLWKHQRKECCLVFPEGIEKKYWPDKGLNMTQYWEKDLLLFGFRKIVNVSLNYCFRNWLSDHFTLSVIVLPECINFLVPGVHLKSVLRSVLGPRSCLYFQGFWGSKLLNGCLVVWPGNWGLLGIKWFSGFKTDI